MELFRIRFINKIRPDTIEIRYRAVLESHSSDTVFEGHQLFLRSYLDTTILKSGEVALKQFIIFFLPLQKTWSWIKWLLNSRMTEASCRSQPSSSLINTSSIMACWVASFTTRERTASRLSIPN